ncbi:GreA/GreB family elongation factor [Acinetobacter guillouiae]|uniref:GreA/GreB family elongation factor n=1 Tax=Acinetobacter guillouiae TaxID=106649 RepID=UPI003AF47FFD
MAYSQIIPLPTTEQDFEAMCAHIFGKKFQCDLPTMYGRRGQKQFGLDIIIHQNNHFDKQNRIGIQCKHVQQLSFDNVSGDSVLKEVKKADEGSQKIKLLIIATTIKSDRVLQDKVAVFSEEREKQGLFPVTIRFWNDLSNDINSDQQLATFYLSSSPIINYHFKNIEDHIKNEQFNSALTLINNNQLLDKFDIVNKFKSLLLKAKCHNYLDQLEEAKETIDELEKYKWHDEQYAAIRLRFLQKSQKDNFIKELDLDLKKYIDSDEIKIIYYSEKIIDRDHEIIISDIEPKLANNLNIRYCFLIRYNQVQDYNNFFKIYNTLDIKEKERFSIRIIHAAMRINKYRLNRSNENKVDLEESISSLEPYQNIIFKIERPDLKTSAINVLIKSYIVLNKYKEIIELYKFINDLKLITPENIEDFITISQNKNDTSFFIEISEKHFNKVEEQTKVFILEKMVYLERLDFLEGKIENLKDDDKNFIKSLIWTKTLNDHDFILKINEENALSFNSLHSNMSIAVRLKDIENTEILYEKFNNKIEQHENTESEIRALSLYYYTTEQYKNAIKYLEILNTQVENPHTIVQLFESYIRINNFKKAKELFTNNIHNISYLTDLVHLCYEMAQQTMDWSLCEILVRDLNISHQDKAWLWMLKIQISYQLKSKPEQLKVIRNIPEDVEGLPNTICWLAYIETLNKLQKKAKKRIKKLWRENLNDLNTETEIFKLLLSFIHNEKERDSFFLEDIKEVSAGMAIHYKSNKKEDTLVIDFYDQPNIGNNFISPTSSLGKDLIGKKIGDKFIIINNFGVNNEYIILEIQPILLFIWHDLLKKTDQLNNPFNFVESFSVDTESEAGIQIFIDQLSKHSQKRKEAFNHWILSYKNNPLTICLLAKVFGLDLAELVYEWDTNFTQPLYSIDNKYISEDEEREYFIKNSNNIHSITIDLYTLIELKYFDCFHILENFEQIYLSSNILQQLKETIQIKKLNIESNNRKGVLTFNKNSPIFVEPNLTYEQKILDDLTYILDSIENNANYIIESTYGDGNLSEMDMLLYDLLTPEENSILRLCRGVKIPLVSFDARIRALSKQVGITTLNMDDIIMHYQPKENSFFPEYKFIRHRTISKTYSNSNRLPSFFFSNSENLYKFITIAFNNFSEHKIHEAAIFYVKFLKDFLLNIFNMTYETIDYLNKLFLIFYSDKNNNSSTFNELKECIFIYLPEHYKKLNSYTNDYESILKTKHRNIKILQGTENPLLYLEK